MQASRMPGLHWFALNRNLRRQLGNSVHAADDVNRLIVFKHRRQRQRFLRKRLHAALFASRTLSLREILQEKNILRNYFGHRKILPRLFNLNPQALCFLDAQQFSRLKKAPIEMIFNERFQMLISCFADYLAADLRETPVFLAAGFAAGLAAAGFAEVFLAVAVFAAAGALASADLAGALTVFAAVLAGAFSWAFSAAGFGAAIL